MGNGDTPSTETEKKDQPQQTTNTERCEAPTYPWDQDAPRSEGDAPERSADAGTERQAKPTDPWNVEASRGLAGSPESPQEAQQRLEKLERSVPEGGTSIRTDKAKTEIYEVDRSKPGETTVTDLRTGRQDVRVDFPDEVVEGDPTKESAASRKGAGQGDGAETREEKQADKAQERLEKLEKSVAKGSTAIRTDPSGKRTYEVDRSTPDRTTVTDLKTGRQEMRIEFDDEVVEVGGKGEQPFRGDGILRERFSPKGFETYVNRTLTEARRGGNGAIAATNIAARMEPDDVREAGSDPVSRRTLATLYQEIISNPPENGRTQADKLLAGFERRTSIEQREAAIEAGTAVFPARFTVFGPAHITARLTAEGKVWVKIPQHTMGDPKFKRELSTLPLDVFTRGLELDPRSTIGVKLYDEGGITVHRPALYLLDMSAQSSGETTTSILNVGSLAVPGGVAVRGGLFAKGAMRVAEKALDAAATTLIASNLVVREARGWIIERYGDTGREFVEVWDRAAFYASLYGVGNAMASAAIGPRLQRAWKNIEGRSSGFTGSDREMFDKVRRSMDDYMKKADEVRPGDTRRTTRPEPAASQPRATTVDELDDALDRSFDATFTDPAPDAPSAQGPPDTRAPEIRLGFSPTELEAVKDVLGSRMTSSKLERLGEIWRQTENAGEVQTLTLENSRPRFNNHRQRFWRAVRKDQAARRVFEDAGFSFSGGATTAPVRELADGRQIRVTIDHIVERQTAPGRALDPSNLQFSLTRENTVVLRQLHDQDPFVNR